MNSFLRAFLRIIYRLIGRSFDQPKAQPTTAPVKPPAPKPIEETPKIETPEPAPLPIPAPAFPPLPKELEHRIVTERSRRVFIVTDGNLEGRFPEHNDTRRNWQGLYNSGKLSIKGFIQTDGAMLKDLDMTDSAINVMSAVSDNEGKLEAINAYDGAFLSFGIFQWTLGTQDRDGELPAMLRGLKEAYPDAFEHYFGQFGLDVHPETGRTYGFLSLNDKKLRPRQEKKLLRNWDWVYRFWRAGLDKHVQAVQIQHALGRLKTFYWTQKAHGFTLNQIITSEFGVGLILDNHVNLPDFPWRCIQAAMTQTGLTNPTNWTTAEERKVLEKYLDIRTTFTHAYREGQRPVGPMFDARKRGETTRRYLKDGLISDERNSFLYSTRGRSLRNEVAAPEGFDPQDYPEIRMEIAEPEDAA